MTTSSVFHQSYKIERLVRQVDESFSFRTFRFPGGTPASTNEEGVKFLVMPLHAKAWIAVIAPGPFFANEKSAKIYPCPNSRHFCVVANGQAFVLDSENPHNWVTVPCFPVRSVTAIPEHQLLIFSDFSMLAAWGKNGLSWTVRTLACDGLEIDNWDEHLIYGKTRDINGPLSLSPFQIDVKSGRCIGNGLIAGSQVPTAGAALEARKRWFGPFITKDDTPKIEASS